MKAVLKNSLGGLDGLDPTSDEEYNMKYIILYILLIRIFYHGWEFYKSPKNNLMYEGVNQTMTSKVATNLKKEHKNYEFYRKYYS